MQIANEITELGDRLEVNIFFGRFYDPRKWHVQIKLLDDNDKIEVNRYSADLENALTEAWASIHDIVSGGMTKSILLPVEDIKKLEIDDEIPF